MLNTKVLLLCCAAALLCGQAFAADAASEDAAKTDIKKALRHMLIVQEFHGDDDIGQCNGAAYGHIVSQANVFSPAIRMDTDGRSGGCQYQIGIVDPTNTLQNIGFSATMQFYADGDPGQCGNPGTYNIPVSPTGSALTPAIRIDTDNRSGGCQQIWSSSNVPNAYHVALEISFMPDGDAGQCGSFGVKSTAHGANAQFRLDMDNRSGGCRQSIRLIYVP